MSDDLPPLPEPVNAADVGQIILPDAFCSIDFHYGKWTDFVSAWKLDENTMFTAEWSGHYWNCTAPGFGLLHAYGNGSVFVLDREGLRRADDEPVRIGELLTEDPDAWEDA